MGSLSHVCAKLPESYLTLCDPTRCSPPDFCAWNSPGKDTGWVAMPASIGSSWPRDWTQISLFIKLIDSNWRLIALQYCGGLCNASTWVSHGCTHASRAPCHLPAHPTTRGSPRAPALSALHHALNLHWASISHTVTYVCQCFSLKSSHPRLFPQSPKVYYLHLWLFCCLAYKIVVNSIYMHAFSMPYICVHIQYWCFFFWFTSLCIMGSNFIHLIRTDSNVFLYIAE